MAAEMVPFDWKRMFLGDMPASILLEIAFRTAWMYLFALIVARTIGKRAMGDTTPFDNLIIIAIGSATGDPMLGPAVPLLHGMMVLTAVVLLERFVARMAVRSGRIEKLVDSTPSPVVRDGAVVEEWLERERVSRGELMSMLRLNGVRDVGEVERAFLEPTGTLSVFLYPEDKARQVCSTFPPRHVEEHPL